jgi:hypothetical protein
MKYVLLAILIILLISLVIGQHIEEPFVLGTTGISYICTPNMPDYNSCVDISYIDATTSDSIHVKAKIKDNYYIDASGLLGIVPYGYTVSTDKHSFIPKTNAAKYESVIYGNTNAIIDASINYIQGLIASTPTSKKVLIDGYQQEIKDLQQQKINVINNNTTSSTSYNHDNLNITYHADPLAETPPDANSLAVGQMWIKDSNGELKSVPYGSVKNTTLYNASGSYVFNPPSYVPSYEESVFLSKGSNPFSLIENKSDSESDICTNTQSSAINRETKCNALDSTKCAKSNCCVLLGGQKCVAGNETGPVIQSNYSDITIANRDYYYYRGVCHGNCNRL